MGFCAEPPYRRDGTLRIGRLLERRHVDELFGDGRYNGLVMIKRASDSKGLFGCAMQIDSRTRRTPRENRGRYARFD